MNEKSRIMALVMTALLVIGAFTALAPVMSGTSITNNESGDTYITTQTIDPGDSVKLMNFTVGASGDQHVTGYSISPGTQLLETPPDSWTDAGAEPFMYHDAGTAGTWEDEEDIIAFDDDNDGMWTAQADLSLAGISVTQAAAIGGLTHWNQWNDTIKFKDLGTAGTWESGSDSIIKDVNDDNTYSSIQDTVINTGDDSTIDTTVDTENQSHVSTIPADTYYYTTGKDDVVEDPDGDGYFTSEADVVIDVDGTTTNDVGGSKSDGDEGNTLTSFDSTDSVRMMDIDGDGSVLTGQLFIYIDNSNDGTFNLSDDNYGDIILDENDTAKSVLDNYYNGTSNKNIANYHNIYKYDGTVTYTDGDDIVKDTGGKGTYSIERDPILNDGGSVDIENKDELNDVQDWYGDAYWADVTETGSYGEGDEIFRDLDSNGKFTPDADVLLAGNEPSNGASITEENPWTDRVKFIDGGTAGVWQPSNDAILFDYHDGGTVSVGSDTEIAGNVTGEDGTSLVPYDTDGTPWDLDFYNMYPGGEWTPSQDAIVQDADGNNYYQDVLTNIEIDNTEGVYPLGLESDQVTFHVWKDLKPSDGHNASDTANETQLADPTWSSTSETWTLSLSEDILVDTTIHVYMDTSADITGDPKITPEVTTTFVSGTDDLTSSNTVTVDGPPGVQWARTADDDNDGMVDHIHVNYTEYMGVTGIGTLNDVTFDNATIVDLSIDETWTTTMVMYELETPKPPEWTSYADFDETFITDDTGKNLASGQDQPVVDWVGPYLESCEVEIGARAATVTFSENVASYGSGAFDYFVTSGTLSVASMSLSGAQTATLIFNRAVVGTDITSTINTGQGVRDGVSGVALTDATDEYSLVTGWNVVSIPRAVAGTLDLADNATGVISNMWAFDAQNQEWYHPTTVEPLDAVFVYAEGPQQITFTYKTPQPTDTPPTKDMYAGWNFVGPNMDPSSEVQVTVENLLASVEGQYSVVFSPVFNHGGSWTVTPNNAGSETMKCFEGYWVYMNSDGTLAGRSA